MKKVKTLVLGIAAAGVLLAGIGHFAPAVATSINAFVKDYITASTRLRGPSPATQALAAGFTITANACGGVKLVSASATVTSDTTNTFTAAATAGVCAMNVVNIGTNEIILDINTEFPATTSGAASIRLASGGSIDVYSNGTTWYHGTWTEY